MSARYIPFFLCSCMRSVRYLRFFAQKKVVSDSFEVHLKVSKQLFLIFDFFHWLKLDLIEMAKLACDQLCQRTLRMHEIGLQKKKNYEEFHVLKSCIFPSGGLETAHGVGSLSWTWRPKKNLLQLQKEVFFWFNCKMLNFWASKTWSWIRIQVHQKAWVWIDPYPV